MVEQKAVLEITDTEVRLLVGYVKDDIPHLVFSTARSVTGLIRNGEIVDYKTLTEIIGSLRDIRDESNKEKIGVNQVTVILPAVGLNVYESDSSSHVVGEDNVIQEVDITNVVSLISKESIPTNNDIIDIIPDKFTLDGGVTTSFPPIGKVSKEIALHAKIHTLPSKTVAEYKKVIENAHFSIERFCLNSYAAAELGKFTQGIPASYILVDMGSDVCGITLVGNNSPIGTTTFPGGGKFIINKLIEAYHIEQDEGLDLLTNFGYSTRELSFEPAIFRKEIDHQEVEITQGELNEIIKNYFANEFFPAFDVAFDSFLSRFSDPIKKLPIVFTGGFSMMIGFKELADKKFVNNKPLNFLAPTCLGARTAQMTVSVGGLMIACSKKGAYSEQKASRKFGR